MKQSICPALFSCLKRKKPYKICYRSFLWNVIGANYWQARGLRFYRNNPQPLKKRGERQYIKGL